MSEVGEIIGLSVAISAILTFIGTRLWDAWRMESKYRTKTDAKKCMEERAKTEKAIFRVLRRMEKRLALSNLVMRDLVRAVPEVPNNKIEQYEKDLDIQLGDRNFSIPEDI